MQKIVHTVFLHQTKQYWEKACLVADYFLGSQNIFFQNESQNLNNFHATDAHFGPTLS